MNAALIVVASLDTKDVFDDWSCVDQRRHGAAFVLSNDALNG